MAYMKQAFVGLGITFAAIAAYSGTKGLSMRNTIDKSKHKMEQVGVNTKQMQQIEQVMGKPDAIDNVMGQPLCESSYAAKYEKMAQYMENIAHSNKVKIQNMNVKQVAQKVAETVKPIIALRP